MYRKIRSAASISAAFILAAGLVCRPNIVCASQDGQEDKAGTDNSAASELSWENYGQTIYNTTDGLTSNNVSSIAQTGDGIVWIGTDEGLDAYDGNEFTQYGSFFHFDGVNDMVGTADGGVWFATTTYGGAVYLGSRFQHFDDAGEQVSNYATCIAEGNDGRIYVGTFRNMLVIDPAGGFVRTELVGDEYFHVNSVAAGEKLTAAANINGDMVFLEGGEQVKRLEAGFTGEAALGFAEGYFLVGTSEGSIIAVAEKDVDAGEAFRVKSPVTKIDGTQSRINDFFYEDGKRLWVLCEDGIGYFTLGSGGIAGLEKADFTLCSFDDFESGFTDMMMDYQGNYWISSSKRGVLLLRESVFTDEFAQLGLDEDVINAVLVAGNVIYAATDSGILAVDTEGKEPVENELTEVFDGQRVVDMEMSGGNMYVAVYGEGVCDGTGELIVEARRPNRIQMLDGGLYVLTDEGCTVWDGTGVSQSFGREDGLYNTRLSCAVSGIFGKKTEERLYLASQGAGIYVLLDGRLEECIDENMGLPSKYVNDLAVYDNGFFAATDRGVAYYNGKKIVELSNMPKELAQQRCKYVFVRDDKLYAACENALFVIELKSLFADGNSGASYELYDVNAGFFGTLTDGGHGFMDNDGRIYLPCGRKIYSFADEGEEFDISSLKLMLQSVKADKRSVEIVKKGENEYEVNLLKDVEELDIFCSVLNFSNEDPYVRYILPGVDTEYTIVRLSELEHIVYKNLEGGSCQFYFELLGDEKDEKGNALPEKTIVLTINKEQSLFEKLWVRMALLGAGFGILMYFVFKDRKHK